MNDFPDNVIVVNKLKNVMTIGINRPETCNALNYETASRLSDAVSLLEEDDSVSVGVIHGIAGNFCSGFDLKEMNNDPNLAEKLTGLVSYFVDIHLIQVVIVKMKMYLLNCVYRFLT